MVRSSTRSHLDEEDEAEDYDSSSYKGEGVVVKADGKSSEQKPNTHRSKHSETEQRRRSKINERFQILRDLIPQNDQKRDKASFLLEVIEYIQFLQGKLQMYEGAYPGWSQEPAKLIPWKNHHSSADGLLDHSQVMKNGSAPENVTVLSSVQNSIESDLGSGLIYRALDHSPGSSPAVTQSLIYTAQMQPNLFASVERGGLPAQSLQESVSDAENMTYQIQPQLWQDRSCNTECTVSNNSLNGHDELISDNGQLSDNNVSRAYSKGVMNTLTQALRFSGVDLSETKIAVQIDVSKRSNRVTSENQYLKSRSMEQTGVRSCLEDSDPSCKRQRTETG